MLSLLLNKTVITLSQDVWLVMNQSVGPLGYFNRFSTIVTIDESDKFVFTQHHQWFKSIEIFGIFIIVATIKCHFSFFLFRLAQIS